MTQSEIEKDEHPRIQSYVADKFFVSTAWRESSSIMGGWYYETIVWEWDKKTKETGEMIFMDTGLHGHFDCCKRLLEGKPLEDEEESAVRLTTEVLL